ncbi:MAG TPA: lysophospholipid acyltransferase family protein [Methylocystis sp.]|nr:lysophospholipid acyltransferase family protein [Methylocystis sp.]
MLFLRSLVFQIAYYLNTIVLMLIWLPTMPFGRHIVLELGRQWGRNSLWLAEKICGLKHEFRGLENIPKGALIVACKHQSVWDTFTLPILFPDFSYILKRELIFLPLFGWYLLAAEQVAIDRAKRGKLLPQLARRATAIFAQGRQLFIFPEGTRRPPGAPPEYKFGVAHLYAETGVRVLPAALNAGLFWGRRAFTIRPGTVVLEFLPPIEPGLPPREFLALLQDRIESASDRLLDEAAAKDATLAGILERNRRAARQKAEAAASDAGAERPNG